jgi:argininosuccinate synthase
MSNNKIGKLVIAYSGGLDTSYCAVSLSKEYDVHAVSVNTGGFTSEEIKNIESNAYKMGVSTYKNINAVATFYIFYFFRSNTSSIYTNSMYIVFF